MIYSKSTLLFLEFKVNNKDKTNIRKGDNMQNLGLNEIRERYLSFFESKGHLRLPSFPLVPQNDASLLLINAGMAPLKPYFTGKETPPRKRVTTCQKCIRTPDIERVGKTARHATFFEMLGNFSFGDYFKKEAIAWAWEFVTQDLKLPTDRLWVSIYEEDDEAFEIWTKEIGVSEDRVIKLGKEDNFWEIGTGPCGPCSEIYYDKGEEAGCGQPDCAVGCDCDRFVEFWNLVFTQFDKDEQGNYNRLANPNIDTGMGLERLAAIMQGVNSLFEVDTVKNIMTHVSKLAGVQYKTNDKTDVSLRVITDHIRSTTFMVSDGILPSNEGRGYVLRRLLRRAARHGKLLGIDKPFLYEVAETVINESKEAYPELEKKKEYIKKVIKVEEERFDETIDQGLSILNQYVDELKNENSRILSGDKAFKLYDTYGFPIDLTKEILIEHGIDVDEEGFNQEMNLQRERARAARQDMDAAGWNDNVFARMDKSIHTQFIGYFQFASVSRVLAIVKDDQEVDTLSKGNTDIKDQITIILDQTPFYGESGGQVGDTGILENNHVKIKVIDCKKLGDGKILHICKLESGIVSKGDEVKAVIDLERRKAISRNHTATHLMQKALRNTLGEHVAQSGSQVAPDRLRFDFSHYAAMTKEEIDKVEKEVNKVILNSLPIDAKEMPIEEARKMGATALFGEKYGDVVRLVKMGEYSLELCGGCHLTNTSQVGMFKIISESGVAAGTRRIEAVTGFGALDYVEQKEKLLEQIATIVKSSPSDVTKKVETLINELKTSQKEVESLRSKLARSSANDIMSNVVKVKGIKTVTARMDELNIDGLRNMGDTLKDKLGSGVVILATANDGKVNFVAMATKDVVAKGIHVGNIIREVAKITGGGGGGRPDMAQAGGKDASKIDDALNQVTSLIEQQIK
ncbi:MAG: alanyl-tRNA synthetase [Clostridiales bacterium]|nr:alanyl-tRNA synthetase [Clostridiales bacterium]